MTDWSLLYPELAKSYYNLEMENKAVDLLEAKLSQDSLFVNILPYCYFLKANDRYQALLPKIEFGQHDWLEAIFALIDFGMNEEALQEAKPLLDKYGGCSYLHYLIGRGHENLNQPTQALKHYQKAITLDHENSEARIGIQNLNKK